VKPRRIILSVIFCLFILGLDSFVIHDSLVLVGYVDGVPTVRDRVAHVTPKQLLELVFEPLFPDHSDGFRRERSQRWAIDAVA